MRKLTLALIVCATAHSANAQNTDIESLAGLIFNLGNPGARSLAMGGAFLGLADDASAAEANPAGLTVLRKPEVSFEVRNYEQKQYFSTSGTFPDVQRTGFAMNNRLIEPTFASYVYPIRDFAVGIYYDETLRNKGRGEVIPQRDPFSGAIIANVPNFYLPKNGAPVSKAECDDIRKRTNDLFACLEFTVSPFLTTINLKSETAGIVGAYKLKNVSFGVDVRLQRFTETATSLLVDPSFNTSLQRLQKSGRSGASTGKAANDVTFTTGIKWTVTDKLGFGATYKRGAKFATPSFVASEENKFQYMKVADTTFHLPDVYGAGISFRPISVLTVNVDAVRVTYSNLIDDFHSLNGDDIARLQNPYIVRDGTEIHVGAEYFFRARVPFALRGGWWRDPAHNLQYRGPLTTPEQIAVALLFPRGKAEQHLSVGAGWSWPRFEIDAAYDWARSNKIGSLSFVERF